MKTILALVSTLLFCACASLSSQGDYANSESYQQREVLKESLGKPEAQNLSADEIKTLLTSKIDLKRPLKIAVVKNENFVNHGGRRAKPMTPIATPEGVGAFKGILAKSKYIQDVSLVPQFMMPADSSIRNLRDVAALMQADLVLVVFPRTGTETNYAFLGSDKAKAVATIESILVDVRTGAIPFTSIATGTAVIEKDKKTDFSDDDFRTRTVLAAEDRALAELANDLVAFVH